MADGASAGANAAFKVEHREGVLVAFNRFRCNRQDGLYASGLSFKNPVTTVNTGTGGVSGSPYISLSRLCQCRNEGRTVRSFCHIAAVQQNICIHIERAANSRQFAAVVIQILRRQIKRPQVQRSLGTMREDVNGINAAAPIEYLYHLGQTVPGRVEDMNFRPRLQPCQQGLVVNDVTFDEHDFSAHATGWRCGQSEGLQVDGICVGTGVTRFKYMRYIGHRSHGRPVKHEALLQRQGPNTVQRELAPARQGAGRAFSTHHETPRQQGRLAAFGATAGSRLTLAAHTLGNSHKGAGNFIPDSAVQTIHGDAPSGG